mmetsp:Transcript_2044/g.3613  ORF Transcript_2044/g.3613 Transcript_2044/m.3613 type:complete len:140 (-) Transcript_2044:936-1355(-)|eukprot:CAMPEP_0168611744 /NCGR_PEP_ID=MMETSP0449_2-20121227/2524_1 /TAXON_ID=1082188 /ORGANISM="Strombidium rassoulzadegani, Strain ras09" /LENGTH=139 /DNA_ID=CAMNT_0008652217 /DNA_START=43 /DNA_END=462 /DNA_ORIENTATION=-
MQYLLLAPFLNPQVRSKFKEDLIFVPRSSHPRGPDAVTKIPCMLLTHIKSTKLMIYLHGNGEDLMMSRQQLDIIRINLKINILAIEYPNYEENYIDLKSDPQPGAKSDSSKQERGKVNTEVDQILSDCLDVYKVISEVC